MRRIEKNRWSRYLEPGNGYPDTYVESTREDDMDQTQRTVDLFSDGMTCSQAMLTAFGGASGLDMELAARLGRPLGGGMGRSGRTCGAPTAAVLPLGLARDDEDEAE